VTLHTVERSSSTRTTHGHASDLPGPRRGGSLDALQLVIMAPMSGVSYRPVRALVCHRSCYASQSSLKGR
jgi:hypothetical protein